MTVLVCSNWFFFIFHFLLTIQKLNNHDWKLIICWIWFFFNVCAIFYWKFWKLVWILYRFDTDMQYWWYGYGPLGMSNKFFTACQIGKTKTIIKLELLGFFFVSYKKSLMRIRVSQYQCIDIHSCNHPNMSYTVNSSRNYCNCPSH